jgi:hypothetical protein
MFNLNFQGIGYGGDRIARNESFIYGSVDPLMYNLALPRNDFEVLLN